MSKEGPTEGDPLAMATYTISAVPLIHRLSQSKPGLPMMSQQLGTFLLFRCGGTDRLVPKYGHYPNPPETWLIVKEEFFSQANQIFQGSGVSSPRMARGIWEQLLARILLRQHTSKRRLLYRFMK